MQLRQVRAIGNAPQVNLPQPAQRLHVFPWRGLCLRQVGELAQGLVRQTIRRSKPN